MTKHGDIYDGICPRALKILEPHTQDRRTYSLLRNVLPRRQREITDLMQMSADYTVGFMQLLVAASNQSDFVRPKTRTIGITKKEQAAIELTISEMEIAFRKLVPNYRKAALTFLVSRAFARRLVRNEHVLKYLRTFYPIQCNELMRLVGTTREGTKGAEAGLPVSRKNWAPLVP